MKLSSYKSRITKSLRAQGIYTPGLAFQVDNLASAMMARDIAIKAIEGLDSPVVTEEFSNGREKVMPHPAFKILRDAQDQVNRQLKQLNMTVADLVGAPEKKGPLDELTETIDRI